MKKNIVKEIFTSLILIIGFIFAGCSDGLKSEDNYLSEKTYTLSGKILTSNENSPRHASPSFTSIESSLKFEKVQVVANKEGNDTITVDASFNAITNAFEYALLLPIPGEWKITVSYLCKQESDFIPLAMSDEINIIIDENYSSKNQDIILKPILQTSVTGSANLLIKDDTEELTSCVIDYEYFENLSDIEPEHKTYTYYFDSNDNLCNIRLNDLRPDSYEVLLSFYKNESLVYSRNEIINIFSGFITDLWSGNNVVTPEKGLPYLNITNELIESYTNVNDSLKAHKEINANKPSETPYVLWSDSKVKQSDTSGSNVEIVEGPSSSAIGLQVFDSLSFGQDVTKTIGSYYDFCFDGETLWGLSAQMKEPEGGGWPYEEDILQGFKFSYSGYVQDTSKTYNLTNLLEQKIGAPDSDNQNHRYRVKSIDVDDGKLYFSWMLSDTPDSTGTIYPSQVSKVGITCVNISDFSNDSNWSWTEEITSNLNTDERTYTVYGLSQIVVSGNIIYFTTDDSYNNEYVKNIYKKTISITDNGTHGTITLSGSDYFTISPDTFGLDSDEVHIEVTDLLIQENYLYATVKESKRYSLYTKISEGDYNNEEQYINNGGILRFNLANESFEAGEWDSSLPVPKILGWYTNPNVVVNSTDSLKSRANANSSDKPFTGKASLQAPLSFANNYFYGARKFIAIKPEKLIIADDGAFVENKNAKTNLNWKTRVMTVDLATQSISAVDVNATFSAQFHSSGYYID